MNAAQYLHVLQSRMLPQLMEWYRSVNDCVYMHDGAPCHQARVVKAYLNTESVNVLPWPGNSPDLNPLENVWGFVKARLAAATLNTKQELISALVKEWVRDETFVSRIQKCIDSMPRRIQAVIAAKGGHTTY